MSTLTKSFASFRTKAFTTLFTISAAACASSGGSQAPATTPAADTTPATAADTVAATTAATAIAADATTTVTTPAGAGGTFTAEQADRGRDLFRARCTECHYSGEFVASRFRYRWSPGSAGSLYQFVQTSMPETAPGSLEPAEAVALVTYILRMNGFETGGVALPPDRVILDEISLASMRGN